MDGLNRPASHPNSTSSPPSPSDSMNPQRARRPTAWQVSFPDEISDGGDGDEKEEEGAERDLEGLEDNLPVLSCKRKRSSNIDDRVRSLPPLSSLLPGSHVMSLKCNSRRNAVVENPH